MILLFEESTRLSRGIHHHISSFYKVTVCIGDILMYDNGIRVRRVLKVFLTKWCQKMAAREEEIYDQ